MMSILPLSEAALLVRWSWLENLANAAKLLRVAVQQPTEKSELLHLEIIFLHGASLRLCLSLWDPSCFWQL